MRKSHRAVIAGAWVSLILGLLAAMPPTLADVISSNLQDADTLTFNSIKTGFTPVNNPEINSVAVANTGRSPLTGNQIHGTAKPTAAKIDAGYGKLPLSFVQNDGQLDRQVLYYEKGKDRTIFFTQEGVTLALKAAPTTDDSTDARSALVRLIPEGADPDATVIAEAPLPGKVNYLIGNDPAKWKTSIPTYRAVVYQSLYPGIDLKFYGNNRQMEYDIIVKPGADPSQVKLTYEGIEGLRVTEAGDLEIALEGGAVLQKKPIVYQLIDGKRVDVIGSFKLQHTSRQARSFSYAFEVASYDRTHPLVIDPVLVYSTYLGGSGLEQGFAIAVDGSGNAYVTGDTASTDFPTVNPIQAVFGGDQDVFVTKIDASGTAMVYSTYLGGSTNDEGFGIAVDGSGNAYVTGYTNSTNFPTANPIQGALYDTFGNVFDAFVTKLNTSGTALLYSTYLGGTGSDFGDGITVDGAGNAYVTGRTTSTFCPDVGTVCFPTTAGAFQPFGNPFGAQDAFVTKLNAAGTAFVFSTFLGGSASENGRDIAVDSSGNVYVVGGTSSPDFPTATSLQAVYGGGTADAFVTRLNASGTGLLYSTYLGGSGNELGLGIAVDVSGNAYVIGDTASTDFPTVNPIQAVSGGGVDAFVARINTPGSALVYSTYFGGNGNLEDGRDIAVDCSGNAYVAGITNSTNFPTANPLQATFGGGLRDAFVATINPSGTALDFSTYFGGSGDDIGLAIAVDDSGNAYVTGDTDSTDFPTINPLQAVNGGNLDAFVMKLGPSPSSTGGGTFSPTGCMATPHGAISSMPVLADGKVLFVGKIGVAGGIGGVSAELYDRVTERFTATGNMNFARSVPSVTRLADGRVLVAGGQGTGAAVLSSAEIYDPTTGSFSVTGSMGSPRTSHTATLLPNGKVLIAGGTGPSGLIASAELYDPATGLFTPTGSMITPRAIFTATLLPNGQVLMAGGNTTNAELYDPATGLFIATGSMATTHIFVRVATLLTNGKVLIAGGASGGTVQSTAELYDPTTGTFSPTGDLVTAREEYAATRLDDGTVLFVGGLTVAPGGAVASAELYDPATGTFSATGSMGTVRNAPSATLLPGDGRVLVAGGNRPSQPSPDLLSAELYNPFSGFTPTGSPVVKLPSVTLTFSTVTQSGTTSLERTSSGPTPPAGFSLGNPPTYFNLTTTAIYSGSIQICINYTGITFTGTPTLQHFEGGVWVDTTTSLDTTNRVICGTVTSLSPFIIAQQDIVYYSLSLSTAGTGSGTVSGDGIYAEGQTAAVSATANAGSTFAGWSGPNATECATGSVLMNFNKSCTATFDLVVVPNFDPLKQATQNVNINGGILIRARLLAWIALAKLAYETGHYPACLAALNGYINLVQNSTPQNIAVVDANNLINLATALSNQIPR